MFSLHTRPPLQECFVVTALNPFTYPLAGFSVGGLLRRVQLQQRPSSAVPGLPSDSNLPGIQRLPRRAAVRTAGLHPAVARVCHRHAAKSAACGPSVCSAASSAVRSTISTDRDPSSRTRSAATAIAGTSTRYYGTAPPAPTPPVPFSQCR